MGKEVLNIDLGVEERKNLAKYLVNKEDVILRKPYYDNEVIRVVVRFREGKEIVSVIENFLPDENWYHFMFLIEKKSKQSEKMYSAIFNELQRYLVKSKAIDNQKEMNRISLEMKVSIFCYAFYKLYVER